jgi:3-oxoacyl-[acyl-carrier protein] reductase
MSDIHTSLDGRRALVLGGGKGLGRGAALALARAGSAVGIVGRDNQALDATVESIRRLGVHGIGLSADISRMTGVELLLAQVERELPTPDILLLNGGGPPPLAAVEDNLDEWKRQFEAMFLAFVRITSFCLPAMRERGWGRVLVVSSTSIKEPIAGLTSSNALRAAVAGWAKSLALEVARDGVTINVIMPGRMTTERTKIFDALEAQRREVAVEVIAGERQNEIAVGRYGSAEEFGAVVSFLASDAASYVTGAAIPVDGGLLRSIV